MASKKSQLSDLVAMVPGYEDVYSRSESTLTDACKDYHYFGNFVRKCLGWPKELKKPEYEKLAVDKNYIRFSSAYKDSLFYLPRGKVVFDAAHAYVSMQMQKEGFIELRLPYIFKTDLSEAQKKEHEELGALEQLTTKFGKKRLLHVSIDDYSHLRYASDPVLFDFLSGTEIPAEYDPLKIYTPGDVFRGAKKGEIKRLNRPTVSFIEDYHIFTSDPLKEARDAHIVNSRIMDELCDEWFILCDIGEEFFRGHYEYLRERVEDCRRPALFYVMAKVPNYFIFQFQYRYGISDNRFTTLANLQLDQVNGPRFNIQIKDKGPASIIHGNTTGRMEKVLVALFDQAIKMENEGKKPTLPLWVSPTQVRIIPFNHDYIDDCIAISKRYTERGVRVDVDDRDMKFSKKIECAEKDWIPHILVYGKEEKESDEISLRVRKNQRIGETPVIERTTLNEHFGDLEVKLMGYPKIPHYTSILVSEQKELSFL